MTKEESIERLDYIISRLNLLIEDLSTMKKDFMDFEYEEYFSDKGRIIPGSDEVELVGFFDGGKGENNIGLHVMYFRYWDVFLKFIRISNDEIKNVKRVKLIDKITT